MLNNKILADLLAYKEAIYELCAEKGMINIQFCFSDMYEYKNSLQVIVETTKHTDMFDKLRVGNKIANLIGFDVNIVTLDQIPDAFKEEFLNNLINFHDLKSVNKDESSEKNNLQFKL